MSKDKRDQFLFSAAEQTDPTLGTAITIIIIYRVISFLIIFFLFIYLANSPLMKSRRRGLETTPIQPQSSAVLQEEQQESTLSLGIPMITQQQQQEMMVMEQDRYIDNRSTAIESIESTIAELGGIFQQLATMVAEQRETVQRIDQNTDDIEMNVIGAQRELLKYYTSISSNRWLIIKIFVTIVLFFLLFTFIM
jgi:syntaxin 5